MPLRDIETVTFVCPLFVTGGTEAIHQASMAFNQLGRRSQIHYFGDGAVKRRIGDHILCVTPDDNVCAKAFASYDPCPSSDIHLWKSNLVIVPEVCALEAKSFAPATFGIWWLSVDNALNTNPRLADAAVREQFFADPDVVHFYQSDYALRFLLNNGARHVYKMGDFTSDHFTGVPLATPQRRPRVMYNAKKGRSLAQAFFRANPGIEALSLDGLSPPELARTYRQNSLYIDFGSLPGKDRMPREAAACGAIIFIHNVGAGRELGDFPLHDFFRFNTDDVVSGSLADRVRLALGAPRNCWDMQEPLRTAILGEKPMLMNEIKMLSERMKAMPSVIHFAGNHAQYLDAVGVPARAS